MNSVYPIFATHSFEHHSEVSGYDQLAKRWPDRSCVLPFKRREPSRYTKLGKLGTLLEERQTKSANSIRLYQTINFFARNANLLHVLYGELHLPLPKYVSRRLPIVATFHQPPSHLARSQQRLTFLRKQLDKVDMVVTLCREQEDFFRELVGPQRICFVPHGVDTTFFQPGFANRQRTILLVGGWLRDWSTAARILTRVLETDPDVRVCIINPASDNPLLTSLPQERLRVTGRLTDDELVQEYRLCGLALFSFHAATANNALLEASACGCRIVATNTGGVLDYAAKTARLFAPQDDTSYIANMILNELDQVRYSPIDTEAVAHAASYSWTVIMKELTVLYKKVVKNRKINRGTK